MNDDEFLFQFQEQPREEFAAALYQRISQPMNPKTLVFRRFALGLAIFLLFLVLSILVIGPQRVLAAVRGLFGYVPGAGIVSQETPLRTLAAPVTVERDGITLTVTQVLLSADKTIVVYRVENIPPEAVAGNFIEGATPPPLCESRDSLRLPDGTVMQPSNEQGSGWITGYKWRETFEAIPADVNEATLFISCLMDTIPGKAPENWEIPLRFVPAPPEITVLPVIEISPFPRPTVGGKDKTSTPPSSPLEVERVIEMEDGYLLIGSFHPFTMPNGTVVTVAPWNILKFTDANGQEIDADYASDVDLPGYENGVYPWAYRIWGKYHAWPLTITLEWVEASVPGEAAFEFGTGPNPQPGQEWNINQNLQIGDRTIRILTATRTLDGYSFTFQADPSVVSLGVDIRSAEQYIAPAGGGGGGGGGIGLSVSVSYQGKVPEGNLTVIVSGVTVRVTGPWSVQWSPATPLFADVTLTPAPKACLTDEIWAQVKVNDSASLPPGLTGKLALLGETVVGSDTWGSVTVNLDGNNRQFRSLGAWPTFSPDGTKLVSSGIGLVITDLLAGEQYQLPGTTISDYRTFWSPDGTKIAFFRSSVEEIFVINVDGPGLTQVTNSPQYEILAGWSADGMEIIFASEGADGVQIRSHNLTTGAEQVLFPIPSNKADVVVSQDGRWIAFTDRLGAQDNGLYVSRLDGSERKLVAAMKGTALYFPVWSPDSGWLIVNVFDSEMGDGRARQVLIELDTCRVFLLPDYGGEIYSWGKGE